MGFQSVGILLVSCLRFSYLANAIVLLVLLNEWLIDLSVHFEKKLIVLPSGRYKIIWL